MSKLYDSVDGNSKLFECPGCKCCHQVYVRPLQGKPVWTWNGSMDSPTFSPSIKTWWTDDKKVDHVCHSFVKDGKIQFLTDCTHHLKGQTVELPNVSAD